MKDLLGGEERIDPESGYWNDAFIVNLGKPEDENLNIAPQDLDNWHVDGDFFVSSISDSQSEALIRKTTRFTTSTLLNKLFSSSPSSRRSFLEVEAHTSLRMELV